MIICLRAEESMRGEKRPRDMRTKSMKNTIMTPSYPIAAVVPFHFAILYSNSNDLVHILAETFSRGLNVGFWSFFLEYGTVETLEKTKRVSLASPYRWRSKLPGYFYFTLVGIPRPSGLNKTLWTLICIDLLCSPNKQRVSEKW